jgi:sec-independent protein translocase protein TatA
MRILGLGMQELLVILIVCLLIFGANRLPEIGRAIGKTVRELKKSLKEDATEDQKSSQDHRSP